jgi:hypothetical protein
MYYWNNRIYRPDTDKINCANAMRINGVRLDASSEAFRAVMFQVEVFWVVTPCSVVRGARRHIPEDLDWNEALPSLQGKVVPVLWAPRHKGVLGEWRYSSTHSLTSALDGGEWSASRPGRFTPRERAPGSHWIGGWVGPRAVLDAVVKRKIPSPRRKSNLRTPIVQPIAQRYIDSFCKPRTIHPVQRCLNSYAIDT